MTAYDAVCQCTFSKYPKAKEAYDIVCTDIMRQCTNNPDERNITVFVYEITDQEMNAVMFLLEEGGFTVDAARQLIDGDYFAYFKVRW